MIDEHGIKKVLTLFLNRLVNPLDVVKTRLQENSKNGTQQYKGTMVKKIKKRHRLREDELICCI